MSHQGKGLHRRGKVWWICYKGLDGKITRETTGQTDLQEATKKLNERRMEVQKGEEPILKKESNMRFTEFVGHYAEWAQRQRSFHSKLGFLDQLLTAFGNIELRQFNTLMIERFQTERQNIGNKPATVNRLIATLKHCFTKANDWELVSEAVLKRVRKVKMLPENNRRLRYLTREEITKLVDNCNAEIKPIILTALNTGMRRTEILSFRWDKVDLENGFILLEVTKNGDRREIPINQTLRATLEELFRGTKARPRRLDIPWVFHSPATGKKYLDIKASFKKALKKTGIRDFVFHDLRHCFASQLVMAGVDLTTIKELLGHKTLSMTLRYAHLAPSHKVKAVDILDGIINQNQGSQAASQMKV